MKFLNTLKRNKYFIISFSFLAYAITNLVGGERGLYSYFEKKEIEKKLNFKAIFLKDELKNFQNKNSLLSEKLNEDYLETLYREKLKVGKKQEILIRIDQ